MSEKYQNKYRISSSRMQSWDYGTNGAYFITICTANRVQYFGDILNGNMQLNEIGHLAKNYWLEIPHHFPFIELGNFVMMPNHVHGILIIDKNVIVTAIDVETRLIASLPFIPEIPTPTNKTGGFAGNKNPMFHENISRIIRWYKGRCSFEMRKIHADFAWQPRFYDHIIRNSKSFDTIQNYITNNPQNWNEDKFYE